MRASEQGSEALFFEAHMTRTILWKFASLPSLERTQEFACQKL
jgi:hypothetical protein